ncbi:hypothetical protein MMC16_003330 [Acarospora aff. strigata]|nr:hypothetical protein [Acarospora aff. strigata]
MFRIAVVQSAQAAARSVVCLRSPIPRPSIVRTLVRSTQFAPSVSCPAVRYYSAPAGLSKQEVEGRIVDLLKNFDKLSDASKLSPTSHFSNDLGLDSLDTVEVVMAIEEVPCTRSIFIEAVLTTSQEFSIEIPDKEADAIHSVDKAVEYILAQPDAH